MVAAAVLANLANLQPGAVIPSDLLSQLQSPSGRAANGKEPNA